MAIPTFPHFSEKFGWTPWLTRITPISDVFCGKLYCEVAKGRTTNLRHVYRSDLHYNSTYECTLAAGPRSIESQDVAMVYDGTKCGDSKVSAATLR